MFTMFYLRLDLFYLKGNVMSSVKNIVYAVI